MAHELMHAYLRMRNVTGLADKVEEGLCQLLACLWLDAQHDKLAGVSPPGPLRRDTLPGRGGGGVSAACRPPHGMVMMV